MIETSGARRLVEVLRLVPGFHVGFKSNNLATAAYHGLADEFARRLLLLVDGQRIFQYSRSVVEWNNIPIQLEDIERIEVVRGPNAEGYGSNAFEAIVNTQTDSAAEDRPRRDLIVNAGAVLERSDISNDWLFLPRLSVNYHTNPRNTVRLGFPTGSRQPTLYENEGRAVIRGVGRPLRFIGCSPRGSSGAISTGR